MGKRPATYQDVLDAPARHTAEILGGELFVTPRPAFPHAFTGAEATGSLVSRFHDGGAGGWVVLPEPELWLGPPDAPQAEVVVPDLAGWRRARFRVPDAHGHTLRPDWVAEILSPGTARRDRLQKLPLYAREGVAHAWIVDPLLETVEVFALRDGVYALVATGAGRDEARLPPFDDEALPLGRWWISSLAEGAER